MEIDKKHIVGKVWVNLCRFLLGALFIFSGFVKAVDPLGFFYKIQDYLTAFGMISWFPSYAPLLVGIALSAIEFSVGVFLFLGIRRKVASVLALLLMVVMTPLTLYLALANPVSDCGCFGDAWILTNWQTFGMISWFPSYAPLLVGIALSAIEFSVGVFLFLGIRRKVASVLALLLMVVMTPLTLYLALANPVSDCGCFGDAWILTNWQTFGKNVVLLVAAVSVFKWQDLLVRFITPKMEWMISMYTFLFVFALSFYCLENLPILDFRPYRIGANIKAGMEIPEGAKPSVFESRFILEKGGKRQELTLDKYPDST